MSTTPLPATAIAVPASAATVAAPKPSGFKSFLSHIGHAFKDVFAYLGSTQGQAAIAATEVASVAIATAFNPVVGAALSGVEALINAGLKQVITIESVAAAAGSQSGTGAQKAAAVIGSIAPNVGAFLQSVGIANPSVAQVQALSTAISTGLVGILNSIPAPAVAEPAQ